ncbi:Flocculation suppression protein, partial [Massospora cicadina]
MDHNWARLHGTGFIIHNIGMFETLLMKRHFRNANMASFFRQLKIYGFIRTSDGRKTRGQGLNAWCRFQHIHFNPGNYAGLIHIRRQASRNRAPSSTITSNDYYGQLIENKRNELQPTQNMNQSLLLTP